MPMPPGLVSLVGAGPGDPELLTLRAARRLSEANVVLHDALVPDSVVELSGPALRLSVGKRAGRPSCAQEEIVSIMIRAARRGHRVVRLKCGDPYVLGRGGEEALALARAGIPCEVVPGISTALAAPSAAGIPLTHRGLASGFLVLSGHEPGAYASILEALPPGSLTIVILMGLRAVADLSTRLLGRGWAPRTPSAVLLASFTAEAMTWRGPLAALARWVPPAGATGLPGTLVIGDTVGLEGLPVSGVGVDPAATGAEVALAAEGKDRR